MTEPLSPDGPLKLAVTVDDLFQWKGIPHPDGYTAHGIARSLMDGFERNGVPPVYAFSNTAPADDDRELLTVFDAWCEAGHHVGNHTHHHASLNWVTPAAYIDDIARTEDLIDEWIDRAPTRYFRYCMDMWGDTAAKTDEVQAHLAKAGYTPAPLSFWFYDAQFMIPYWRTLVAGDEDGRAWLQQAFVDTALSQLRHQAAAARAALGRDPVHIALVHGTAVAADTFDRVLVALAEHGVEFVTLEEAMRDPANVIVPPVTTRMFRNFTQKWAEHAGVEVVDTPPRILREVEEIAPVEGMTEADILGPSLAGMAQALGGEASAGDFDW